MKRCTHLPLKIAAVAAAAVLIAAADRLGYVCPFRALTGLPCPGCGMTRAWISLLHGDLSAAFRFHPFFWAVPVLLVFLLTAGRPTGRPKIDRAVLIAVAGGWILFALLRMVIPAWRQFL